MTRHRDEVDACVPLIMIQRDVLSAHAFRHCVSTAFRSAVSYHLTRTAGESRCALDDVLEARHSYTRRQNEVVIIVSASRCTRGVHVDKHTCASLSVTLYCSHCHVKVAVLSLSGFALVYLCLRTAATACIIGSVCGMRRAAAAWSDTQKFWV